MPRQIEDSQVYTATVDVLLAHGYAGATTKLIAAAAKVNEVTLFRKYGSKAQLVSAALAHERAALTKQPISYTGDLKHDLLAIARLFSEASPRQSQLMLLILAEAVRFPELRDAMQVPFALFAHMGGVIAHYQSVGQLRSGDPLLVAGALLGPLVINRLLRTAGSELPIPPIDLTAHVENFLHGYAT